MTVHQGDFTTTSAGQVVENMEIRGRFIVKHANVTLRNSLVLYTTNYGLDNRDNHPGLVVEDTEFDGRNLPTSDARAAGLSYTNGFTLRRVYLHNAPQGFLTYGNTTIEDSYLVVDSYTPEGAHREAVYALGQDHVFRNNYMVCNVPQGGCSAALAVYGEVLVAKNILIEGNYFAASAGYCVYGGGTHEFGSQNENVRLVGNAFDNLYTPESVFCGRVGNWSALNAGVRGNIASGNYYWPSLDPIG